MSEAIQDQEPEPRDEAIDPADAFSLLGNEHRIRILQALWEVPATPVSFSELYNEVDIDDSAHFNYHLEQLTNHFVRRSEDGYELRKPGEKVLRAVLAGSFNTRIRRSIDIDDPCVRCGDPLIAEYEEGTLALRCSHCDHGHGAYSFPPGGLNDRTDEEILEAFDQRVRHLHCLAKDGVCHECNGRMRTYIEREGECCLGSTIRAEHVCEQCEHSLCSAVGLGLLDQSTVVAFYRDHGVDLTTTPYWRLPWCVSDSPVTVRSTDPWILDIDLRFGDHRLSLTLDENLSIVETEHLQA